MSSACFYPFIIIAGVLQAAGAVMNAQLRNDLINSRLASFVSFVLIAFFFASMFAILPRLLPTVQSLSAMPWRGALGGLAGAVAVFAGLTLIDKLGAGTVRPHHRLEYRDLNRDRSFRPSDRLCTRRALGIIGGVLMVGGIALVSTF